MAELNEPAVPPPASCPPAQVVIDGDVTVDISDDVFTELGDQICECIEQQTGELCECIEQQTEKLCECIKEQTGQLCECFTAAIDLVVDAIANQPPPPVVIPLACQPCIAVDGELDPYAMIVLVDGEPTYLTATGQIDPAAVEVLDPCDPRCNAPCDCEPPAEPDLECCENGSCDCTKQDFAALAAIVKG